MSKNHVITPLMFLVVQTLQRRPSEHTAHTPLATRHACGHATLGNHVNTSFYRLANYVLGLASQALAHCASWLTNPITTTTGYANYKRYFNALLKKQYQCENTAHNRSRNYLHKQKQSIMSKQNNVDWPWMLHCWTWKCRYFETWRQKASSKARD